MVKEPRIKKILMWALTYKCNAGCEYCYLKNYSQPFEDITKKQYFMIADKIIKNVTWRPEAVWLTGGEPTMLDFLPELIHLFYCNDIPVVLNTNAIVNEDKLKEILNAKPKGITISLDSTLENEMRAENKRTFAPEIIIKKIKYIIENKNVETIVGTAAVLTRETIERLYDYAKEMRQLGVEYVSINPIHGKNINYNEVASTFLNTILKIRTENIIKIPSVFYTNLIYDFYSSQINDPYLCPALENFFFISPWGYIYPCSNEIWQKDEENAFNLLDMDDWYSEIIDMKEKNGFVSKTTKSSCFGERCIGCWKLYYDSIYT